MREPRPPDIPVGRPFFVSPRPPTAVSHLAPDDIGFSELLLTAYQDVKVGDYWVVEVLDRATRLLHEGLRDGSVHDAAVRLADEAGVFDDAPSLLDFGQFSTDDLDRLLRDGKFRYGRKSERQLVMYDICRQCDGYAAAAPLGDPWLELNVRSFFDEAGKRPAVYTNDTAGMDRLASDMAAVMLHQAMHVEGFLHPDHTGDWFEYAVGGPYYRTLPAIAQQAFYIVNDDRFRGTGHTPSRTRNRPAGCAGVGCRPQATPQNPTPGGAAVLLDSSDERARRQW
ncbi:hypothetical protein LzC2_17500 [Planctomycetes bacterium LzC2]|uniref:Uncharacterized protein n=1 Tax=Alienimonas chondri TaxID=2681879 RepID=A0ABX1VC42_9PLAN|nr:hypothetical protein [Alienimonas chondri]